MTDASNLVGQEIDPAAERQRHLRRLAHQIENGLPVYDLNGERIGDVKEYNAAAGYLQVSAGAFGQKELYLPIRLVADIRAREIHLVAPKDTLAAEYRQPPAIITIVERHAELGATTSQALRAREVQLMPNGYDGRMVEMSAIERYGDRVIVAVEKIYLKSGGNWRQTKQHIRLATADLEVITSEDGDA
jgi:PRC-barrel domain